MTARDGWISHSKLTPQSPVLTLSMASDGLWAGGIGSLALRNERGDWEPKVAGLTLRSVLTIVEVAGTLFAAGVGGVLRSTNRGASWIPAIGTESQTVHLLVASPDGAMLAATADAGVLRSSDGGITWSGSSFGLESRQVLDLLWVHDEVVLVSTPDGLFRSANGGRAWKFHDARVIDLLAQAGEGITALGTNGEVWRSPDRGDSWETLTPLPTDVEIQAMSVSPDGSIIVGTIDHGVLRLSVGAWTSLGNHHVLALTSTPHSLLAGTSEGVLAFDLADSQWRNCGSPPLFDYRRLLVRDRKIFVAGVVSPPRRWSGAEGWQLLDACPQPLRAFVGGWDGELLASTPDGLYASLDGGTTWQLRSSEASGEWITLRADGTGWMAAADGSCLMVTRDRGHTWSALASPFGVLPLVALQAHASESLLLAVSYAQASAVLWRSFDDGNTWTRGNEASTTWPVVATLGDPLAVSIGSAILINGPDGVWMRTQPGRGLIRRLAVSAAGLAALTTDGIWLRRAQADWLATPLPGAVESIIDIALDEANLYVLLTSGEVQELRIEPL